SVADQPVAGANGTNVGDELVMRVDVTNVAVEPITGASGADFTPEAPAGADASQAARWIAWELDANKREPVVAWRGGHRWVPSYERVPLQAPSREPDAIRAGGAYVLTGGAGPLELAVAKRLAAAGAEGIA